MDLMAFTNTEKNVWIPKQNKKLEILFQRGSILIMQWLRALRQAERSTDDV